MEIQQETDQGVTIFTIKGRLDSNTSNTFETAIYESMDNGLTQMIINLEGLEYISSAGLGVLLSTHKRLMSARQGLELVNVNPHINDIFRYSGFDKLFVIRLA